MNAQLKTGFILTSVILLLLLISLFIKPDYSEMNSERRFLPPGPENILGTDNFGRDIFFRVLAGGKYTIFLALCTIASAALLGSALGLFAGYVSGIADEFIMRLMDTISSFPGIIFALSVTALLGSGQLTLFIALTVLFIPGFTRVMRSGTLQYRNADFIIAEKLLGAGYARIIFIHILPNLAAQLFSAAVLGLSNAILAESAMSYLGLGIQPPLPSWGRMLSESQNFLINAPWYSLAPGCLIMLTVIAFHCLGDGLSRFTGK